MPRMGYMDEGPSRGVARPEATAGNIQNGSIAFVNVAGALQRRGARLRRGLRL